MSRIFNYGLLVRDARNEIVEVKPDGQWKALPVVLRGDETRVYRYSDIMPALRRDKLSARYQWGEWKGRLVHGAAPQTRILGAIVVEGVRFLDADGCSCDIMGPFCLSVQVWREAHSYPRNNGGKFTVRPSTFSLVTVGADAFFKAYPGLLSVDAEVLMSEGKLQNLPMLAGTSRYLPNSLQERFLPLMAEYAMKETRTSSPESECPVPMPETDPEVALQEQDDEDFVETFYASMSYRQLQAECKAKGLKASGPKAQLLERLTQ